MLLKQMLLKYGLRGMATFILLLCTLICGGDTCPDHEKTIFEGWERPVLPPIYAETEDTAKKNPDDETTEVTKIVVTSEAKTEAPEEPIQSWVTVGEKITVEEDERGLFPVHIEVNPKTTVFGILLILTTEPRSEIYALTEGSIPSDIHFSYIINNNEAVVLLDGIVGDGMCLSDMIFYVSVEAHVEKLMVNLVEAVEKT